MSVSVLIDPAERRIADQPGVGNKFNYVVNDVCRDPLGHLRVCLSERAGKPEQHVIFYQGEMVFASLDVVVPFVVEVKRRAVINEPESAVPHKHIRVARSTINICHVSVEPDDRRGKVRVGLVRDRIKRYSAGQVVEREIEASARTYQVLYLRVGLGAGEV